MAMEYGFFNSINGDRKKSAEFFMEFFGHIIGNGVYPNPSTNFHVMSNNDMTITVMPGIAWINGTLAFDKFNYIMPIDVADGVLNRIDRVVLRLDTLGREIKIVVKKGVYANTPVAPTLQRDADAYELALADVYIGKGVISITQSNITDQRLNSALCGIVHGVVDQVDTTTLFNQYESWYTQTTGQAQTDIEIIKAQFISDFNDWYTLNTTTWSNEFTTWFDSIKGQLAGDVATNLAAQITDLQSNKANQVDLTTLDTTVEQHLADEIHQKEVHGLRLTDSKLEYFDGLAWQRVKGDGYPVGNISEFSAKGDDKIISLFWQDPADVTITDSLGNLITISKWKGTKILRKTGSYPQNENDGVLVVDSGVRNQYKTTGFVDTGLTNDIDYYYMAFPYTQEDVFTVDVANRVKGIPTEIKIYGVEIDENNSNPETALIYTDDAAGFTPASGNNGAFTWGSWENIIKNDFMIKPCLLNNPTGTVNYYLNYDNFTQKALGGASNLTGADGDVMIEFGQELWWKFRRIGSKLKIQMSTKQFAGAVKHAFEIENGYNQLSFYPLTMLQVLFLIIFKNRDTQTALGKGLVDNGSAYLNTGGTNAKTFCYGSNAGTQQVKFLGLEDYWGNRRQWIDGCYYDGSRNMMIGKSNFNDTGVGYVSNGNASTSDLSGYIDKVQGTNETGFIPKSTSGSETTHYGDYGSLSASCLPYFGGGSSYGSAAGGFYLYSNAASNARADVGGRLCSKFNGKLYIGTYLATNISNKMRSTSGTTSDNNKTIGAFRTLAKANN